MVPNFLGHANSVRPSVRPSVTRVYCIKTAKRIIEILSPSDRPIILVFRHQGLLRKFDGFTPNTHSLTAARNRLWVVAHSMLTGHQQEPMRRSAAVSPVSPHDLTHPCSQSVVYQRGDSNRGVVCLRTWNPRLASEPCVPVYCQANDEYGRRWSDDERLWY